jgi:hypothetical protein
VPGIRTGLKKSISTLVLGAPICDWLSHFAVIFPVT